MIKAILFDFAGVIGVDGYWVWLRENVLDIEAQKDYFEKISDDVDKAVITNKEFVSLIARTTEVPSSQIWPAIYERIKINHEVLAYINKLKKKYKIGLLSNFTHEWLEEIFEKHRLYPYFDTIYISSRYGMIKPEEGAFWKALELLDVKPEEAVFVDDRQINIEAAKKLGIKGILFTGVEQLKKDIHVTMFRNMIA